MPKGRKRRFGRVYWRPSRPGSKSGAYAIRYRYRGREVSRVIGQDRKLAAQTLAAIESSLAREEHLGVREVAAVSFKEFRPVVVRLLTARLTPKSLESVLFQYGVLEGHFASRALKDIGPADIQDFFTMLVTKRGCAPQSTNRYAALLSSIFRQAVDRGFSRDNPVSRIKRVREVMRAVPFLSIADIDRIVAAAPPGLRPLVILAADTGLRRGELLALQWRDIDMARGVLIVRKSKNGKSREVPLTDRAATAFRDLHAARGPLPLVGEDLVFPEIAAMNPAWGALSVTVGFRKAAKKAGFTGLRFHDLRHSFCSRLAQAGVALSTVSLLAGHSSLVVTNRYARHVPQGATHQAIALLGKANPSPAAPAAPASPDSPPSGDARGDAARPAYPPVAASA